HITSQEVFKMKRFFSFALVLACGFGIGWVGRGSDAPPAPVRELLDTGGTITVPRELNEPVLRLPPVNYPVRGPPANELGQGRRRGDEIWYVEIDNLLIACARKN